jgi:hypothetical protein
MTTVPKVLVNIGLALALIAAPGMAKDKKAAKSSDQKASKAAPAGLVDINSASLMQLEALPGVGAATAKKITANRPYTSPGDLTKAGVPAKTIQQITPMITVGPATAPPSASPSGKRPAAAANTTPATPTTATPGATPPAAPTKRAAGQNTATAYTPPPSPGMVWVNPDTKVYHKEGDRWYGKTKDGKYMTEADAIKAGYRAAKK